MNDILRKREVNQEDSIRHSWTARLRARKNEPITSDASCCCFTYTVKKVMLVSCDWWFSISIFL